MRATDSDFQHRSSPVRVEHRITVHRQRRGGQEGQGPEWAALIARELPLLWTALGGDGASAERAAEACEVAWLRLAQTDWNEREPAECSNWLLITARIELSRAVARRQLSRGATMII